jgi:hypothetical protein
MFLYLLAGGTLMTYIEALATAFVVAVVVAVCIAVLALWWYDIDGSDSW